MEFLKDIQIILGILAVAVGGEWTYFIYFRQPKLKEEELIAEKRAERFHSHGLEFPAKYEIWEKQVLEKNQAGDDSWVQQ